jgi:site-specific DNA-methyltransferase (adenine-specific)/modification methylase
MKVEIGNATLYLGDCAEILPTLGHIDAVVTDPPYGIKIDSAMAKSSGVQSGAMKARKGIYEATNWDDSPITKQAIDLLRNISDWQIIFGGNYFELPPTKCWLLWDKEINGNFADAEMAWTNLNKPVKLKRYMWNGMLRANKEPRGDHPTQKPVGIMEWVISHLPAETQSIIDPYMGSGTTGVACVKMGKTFIGIEREPKYFDIACKRIELAYAQPDMFIC